MSGGGRRPPLQAETFRNTIQDGKRYLIFIHGHSENGGLRVSGSSRREDLVSSISCSGDLRSPPIQAKVSVLNT